MASTYSTNLRIELMVDGENSNTWGGKTNTNLTLLEQAVSGVASVAMTDADYTLTTSNAATDEARNAVITMTGTLTQARNIIVPSVDKVYVFKNSTTGGFGIVVKTSGGTGVTVPNGSTMQLYCDATNVEVAATAAGKISFTQPANGATFTLLDGKTLTVNKTLTFDGTDGTVMTFPATSASVARVDAAQTFAGTQTFSGLIEANLGLTVAGAAFNSRGITDSATAKALTLSGSGANSVTIANSATNPIIGTSGGSLAFGAHSLVMSEGEQLQWGGTAVSIAGSNAANVIGFRTNSAEQVRITNTASANRYITLTGSNGGNPTIGTSAGDLLLSPGGGGVVSFGTHSAKAAEAFSGYITIKDAAGNSRKVMVCV